MKLPINYDESHWTTRKKAREEYEVLQQGYCYHCNAPLTLDPSKEMLAKPVTRALFPPNFFKHPVHLHHNHDTGMTIGAVHAYCNAVLWQYHGE